MNKETKQFFYHNNALNKGSLKEVNDFYTSKVRDEFNEVMPSPEVLYAYEEIMPGTIEKLTALMEKEQKHKHAMEDARLAIHQKADYMGKIFAMVFVFAICYVTLDLAKQSLSHAVIFSSGAFFSIFGISLLSKYKNLKQQLKNPKMPNADAERRFEGNNQDSNWKNNKSNYRKPTFKKKF